MRALAGIFVGGTGSRFGGVAKGLLPAPDGSGSILARLLTVLRTQDVEPVLVGHRAEYIHLGIPSIADRGEALGPLGGLLALYDHAGERRAFALACDMPFVTSLAPLQRASAPLAAPKRNGKWEPFFSVHTPSIVRPFAEQLAAAGRLSLQALFDAVPATELDVPACELDDWDTPEDQARTMPMRTMSK